MKKLVYTNDEQFKNDIVCNLLEGHLGWSGSLRHMPSEDLEGVRGAAVFNYIESKFTDEFWFNMDEESKQAERDKATAIFNEAAEIADKKWEAAMTLLGVEIEVEK